MSMIIHISAIVITGLAFLFVIIGESTDYWVQREVDVGFFTTKTNSGLWRTCLETSISDKTCDGIGSGDDKLRTARAFTILALIALGAAFVDLLVVFKYKSWIVGQIISALCAALFLMIGLSVYTDAARDFVKADGSKHGYSYILAWIGFVLSLISAVDGIVYKFMAKG